MKKFIYILFCIALIFSTCQDNNPAPINSNNSNVSVTTYDWYFEIKVDGVVNRIEGTFDNSISTQIDDHYYGPNQGYISLQNPNYIMASLTNKGESTYVTGENFNVQMSISNPNLGLNYVDLYETADMNESYIGLNLTSTLPGNIYFNALWGSGQPYGFYLTPTTVSGPYQTSNSFPIDIVQLPTSSYINNSGVGPYYTIGNPIIGSGAATIYVFDSYSISPTGYYDCEYIKPYNVEISFKLYSPVQ